MNGWTILGEGSLSRVGDTRLNEHLLFFLFFFLLFFFAFFLSFFLAFCSIFLFYSLSSFSIFSFFILFFLPLFFFPYFFFFFFVWVFFSKKLFGFFFRKSKTGISMSSLRVQHRRLCAVERWNENKNCSFLCCVEEENKWIDISWWRLTREKTSAITRSNSRRNGVFHQLPANFLPRRGKVKDNRRSTLTLALGAYVLFARRSDS